MKRCCRNWDSIWRFSIPDVVGWPDRSDSRKSITTSMKVGEHELLPHVRSAPKDTLIIADGFSCREQVSQTTDRRPLHLAEVIKMASDYGPHGPGGDYPERVVVSKARPSDSSPWVAIAAGVAAAGIGLGWWWISRKRAKKLSEP